MIFTAIVSIADQELPQMFTSANILEMNPSLLQKLPEHNVSLLMLLLFGCMYVMSFLRPNEYAKNLGNTKSYLFRVQVWYILHSSLSAMKEKFRP